MWGADPRDTCVARRGGDRWHRLVDEAEVAQVIVLLVAPLVIYEARGNGALLGLILGVWLAIAGGLHRGLFRSAFLCRFGIGGFAQVGPSSGLFS